MKGIYVRNNQIISYSWRFTCKVFKNSEVFIATASKKPL